MQDSKYLEQLRQELVELSPDFAHDEKKIKKLITYMLTHKIKVEQDNHFKDQLADRLSRHIAWTKESHDIDPKVQARTSRLGRFIAYGLPGLALCAIVLFTIPRSPLQTITPVSPSPIQTDIHPEEDSTTLVVQNTPVVGTPHTKVISNPKESLAGSQITTNPASQQISLRTSSPLDNSVGTPAVSSIQPTMIDGGSQAGDSSQTQPILKTAGTPESLGALEMPDASGVSIDIVMPSATLQEWTKFIHHISEKYNRVISVKEGTMLDCIKDINISCTILRDFEFSQENKIKLLDEIIKTLPPDTMDDKKREKLMKLIEL